MGQAHNGIVLSNRKERHTTTRINLSNITEVKKSRSEARLLHEKLPDDKSIETELMPKAGVGAGLEMGNDC